MCKQLRVSWAWFMLCAGLLGLVAAVPAGAFDIEGSTVVVPVVMHGPGKFDSEWRTDVWLANPFSPPLTATLTFYPTSGPPQTTTVDLPPYSAVELPDIVLQTFGLDNIKGMLLASVEAEKRVSVIARVYNVGNPVGEFGQFVPGIGLQRLEQGAYLFGLSGVDGNRTNVGLANPNDVPLDLTLTFRNHNNTDDARIVVHLAPYELKQINDVFAATGFPPQDNVQANIYGATTEYPIYAYASVARDDTGDAIFIFGTGPNT